MTMCTKCVHRIDVPGDCHIGCNNPSTVTLRQWRSCGRWPLLFDEGIVVECAGQSSNPKDRKAGADDPFMTIARLLIR